MTDKIKYTSDGRKVVVIGNLNSNEIIVQEIFVSGSAEIPSGEHFVVKSLHDQPAESWKEKNLRELEARYDKERKSWESKIENLWRSQNLRVGQLEEVAKYMHSLSKKWDVAALETLANFVTGNITHIVRLSWNPKIEPFLDAATETFDYGRVENIKLVSLFGRTDGSLAWNLHRYSDGSGGSEQIIPCTSLTEAVAAMDEYVKTEIERRGVSDWMLKAQQEYGLTNPSEQAKKEFYVKGVAALDARISKTKEGLAKEEAKRAELTKLVATS